MTRFGVHLGLQDTSVAALRRACEAIDESGFSWLSVPDRLAPRPPGPDHPGEGGDWFEAVACQAAMAVSSLRIRLGCLVYSAVHRHPAVLAKAGATIDQLSGGRLELGIGAGWPAEGTDRSAANAEPAAVRLRRMAECVEVVRLLWTQVSTDFDGEFFRLTVARCQPKPVQQPPRIWVGITGPPAALEVAGRLGDGWNAAFVHPDAFARKLAIVKQAAPDPYRVATAVTLGFLAGPGADGRRILRQRFGPGAARLEPGVISGSADAMLDGIGRYVAAGADWIILAPLSPPEGEVIDGLLALEEAASAEFG